ncbi:MAG: DUF971 domain-containing protein [Chloroflexi bacterium]|nr:MAG: DUF971 domain-containing protein [Chloroflexota bacterium]
MAQDPFPAAVDLDRQSQVLIVEWEDGHRSAYAGGMLRWACPCAECRGEGGPGRLDKLSELSPDELELTDVALIGRYALSFGFKSGHSTGIYTFRYLRGICPCEECVRRGG